MKPLNRSRYARVGLLAALTLVLAASLLPAPVEAAPRLKKVVLPWLSTNASNTGLSLGGGSADTAYAALGTGVTDTTANADISRLMLPFSSGVSTADTLLLGRVVLISDSTYTPNITAFTVTPQLVYASEASIGTFLVKSLAAMAFTCPAGDKVVSFPLLAETINSIPFNVNAFGGIVGNPTIRFLIACTAGTSNFGHVRLELHTWEDDGR